MLVEQLEKGEIGVEIQYKRAITSDGNRNAIAIMEQVFEPCDTPWRGLGIIPKSGLKLRPQYR